MGHQDPGEWPEEFQPVEEFVSHQETFIPPSQRVFTLPSRVSGSLKAFVCCVSPTLLHC